MSIPFTWVYLIYDPFTKLTKIGRSDNPEQRLEQLRSTPTVLAAPTEYELIEAWLCPIEIERELHEMCATKRVRGEWFRLDERDRRQIDEALYTYSRRSDRQSKLHDDFDVANLEAWRLSRKCDDLRASLAFYADLYAIMRRWAFLSLSGHSQGFYDGRMLSAAPDDRLPAEEHWKV